MNTYCLLDGAMVHGTIKASKFFADRNAKWFAPLMPHDDLRLAGPLLLCGEQCTSNPEIEAEFLRISKAFPHCLHISYLYSEHTFEAAADHLRKFVYFGDDEGKPYGLRIADCRVLSYLPDVLTKDQWNALTAPFERWLVHDRKGQRGVLDLDEARRQCVGASEGIRLDHEQIDRVIQKAEPDSLLAWIDKDPGATPAQHTQRNHDIARRCLDHWHASGNTNRGVLLAFTRMVFDNGGRALEDPASVQQLFRNATAAVR
jgi:hypothetical protein